jgi:hypothetical protein
VKQTLCTFIEGLSVGSFYEGMMSALTGEAVMSLYNTPDKEEGEIFVNFFR